MPPAVDLEDRLLGKERPAPAGAAGDARERNQRVQAPHPGGRVEDRAGVSDDARDVAPEERLLAFAEARVGRPELLVDLDQLLRGVALDGSERLALRSAFGNLRPRRARHLEDVAEDLVELDPQRADARS